MTLVSLPTSPEGFATAAWADILPFYEELATRPLDRASVEDWLRDWSRLETLVTEAAALAQIAYTVNTEDAGREAVHLRFSTEILPRMDEQGVRLARRLVELGYERPGLGPMLACFRTQIAIFREANVALFSRLEELSARYQKVTGGMMAEWEGRQVTLPQLQPYLRSLNREERERAFYRLNEPYQARQTELAELFTRMYELRSRVADNAGFEDFRAFSFKAKCRFDYGPEDCERFHQAVEAVVSPAVARVYGRRQERLGLDRLRPWDVQVDAFGRPALRPFARVPDLIATSGRVMHRLDPVLGREFDTMAREELLDLDSRKGKAPGGYCETLHFRGRPFIFMNAAGTFDDVTTLFHESGHAFHAFASDALPLIWQRHPSMEAAELASMSMELLAIPQLGAEEGVLSPEEFARARVEHLEDILVSLAHIASVDAFQSWIYTSGQGADAAARDAAWLEIRSRFERGVDWSGLEDLRVARWYRQLHIFLYPFYYIEYGIAQLGALQVWRNSLQDPAGALRRYREALALGNTRSLPEIYAAAGARLVFDREGMAGLVALVEEQLEASEDAIAAGRPV